MTISLLLLKKIKGTISKDTCNDQTGFTKSKIVSDPHVTTAECIKYLFGISNSKSTDCDAFSVRMLKKTFHFIVDIVTDMMNLLREYSLNSLNSGN